MLGDVSVRFSSRRRLSCEHLEARLCLSAVPFASHVILESEANGASSVLAADLDGDGDVDVLSAGGRKIAWYENTDGKGSFGEQTVIRSGTGQAMSVQAADLDGDGDVDVLSASNRDDRIAWYENLGSTIQPGDADENGQFDQIDVTGVLEAGKYRTGEAAEWNEGDWNGDGVFDQLDIVAALQTGNYLQGPYPGDGASVDMAFAEIALQAATLRPFGGPDHAA